MAQSIATDAVGTTRTTDEIANHVEALLDWLRPPLMAWVRAIGTEPLTPTAFLRREWELLALLREFGRLLLER